jgi:hypothetical protein
MARFARPLILGVVAASQASAFQVARPSSSMSSTRRPAVAFEDEVTFKIPTPPKEGDGQRTGAMMDLSGIAMSVRIHRPRRGLTGVGTNIVARHAAT